MPRKKSSGAWGPNRAWKASCDTIIVSECLENMARKVTKSVFDNCDALAIEMTFRGPDLSQTLSLFSVLQTTSKLANTGLALVQFHERAGKLCWRRTRFFSRNEQKEPRQINATLRRHRSPSSKSETHFQYFIVQEFLTKIFILVCCHANAVGRSEKGDKESF